MQSVAKNKKSRLMKKIFLTALSGLIAISAITQKAIQPPPGWGHYKKLAAYSPAPIKGLESIDKLQFDLAEGETRVENLDQAPSSLIANGRARMPYYLSVSEQFEITNPPVNSSAQTRAELDYLLQLQAQRSEEDKRAAAFYAGVYYRTAVKPGDNDYTVMRRNLFHIGRSIGTWFNADSLPITANLVANVWKDAEYIIWKYKNYFIRIRPYKIEPKLENLEETNWAAYPSGHATNSYVNAFLYSELLPEFTSFFIKDAYDMAHSREIIGVHYPSDSESGRLLAFQLIQRLMGNKQFKNDFNAALQEIQTVKKQKGY